MSLTRRSFIQWVIGSGALAALPALGNPELPKDTLSGVCRVDMRLMRVLGSEEEGRKFAQQELAAFERVMDRVWREEGGGHRYVRSATGWWLSPAHGDEPERLCCHIQYRRSW